MQDESCRACVRGRACWRRETQMAESAARFQMLLLHATRGREEPHCSAKDSPDGLLRLLISRKVGGTKLKSLKLSARGQKVCKPTFRAFESAWEASQVRANSEPLLGL